MHRVHFLLRRPPGIQKETVPAFLKRKVGGSWRKAIFAFISSPNHSGGTKRACVCVCAFASSCSSSSFLKLNSPNPLHFASPSLLAPGAPKLKRRDCNKKIESNPQLIPPSPPPRKAFWCLSSIPRYKYSIHIPFPPDAGFGFSPQSPPSYLSIPLQSPAGPMTSCTGPTGLGATTSPFPVNGPILKGLGKGRRRG